MESLMTDTAATTTEGTASSQDAASAAPQGNEQVANQQQANADQNQTSTQDGVKDGAADGNTEGKPQGAPESYEFKAPEGKEFDSETLTAFSEVAKEANLSQEAAQKLLDKMGPTLAQRQMEQFESIKNDWAQSAQSDKEFGGEKLNENLAVAKKALDSFGTPELRTLLNESGLGNNPEVIRFMYRAGKAISEDKFVGSTTGANPRSAPQSFNEQASALYSSQQS
jgi:hypothetical protein